MSDKFDDLAEEIQDSDFSEPTSEEAAVELVERSARLKRSVKKAISEVKSNLQDWWYLYQECDYPNDSAAKAQANNVQKMLESYEEMNRYLMSFRRKLPVMAAASGSLRFGEALLEHGFDPNSSATGEYPISIAADRGTLAYVEFLVDEGAWVAAPATPATRSPIHSAILRRNLQLLRLILRRDVNYPPIEEHEDRSLNAVDYVWEKFSPDVHYRSMFIGALDEVGMKSLHHRLEVDAFVAARRKDRGDNDSWEGAGVFDVDEFIFGGSIDSEDTDCYRIDPKEGTLEGIYVYLESPLSDRSDITVEVFDEEFKRLGSYATDNTIEFEKSGSSKVYYLRVSGNGARAYNMSVSIATDLETL